MTDLEIENVCRALRSGWVAPVGPDIGRFERALGEFTGIPQVVALSSGTAAIELGLRAIGVRAGDDVIIPSMTFAATAFAAVHAGARPVFVDVEDVSWGLDPDLLAEVMANRGREGRLPKAIVTVDIFGRPCNYPAIMEIADGYGVAVLDDAAEALGSRCGSTSLGGFGRAGVFSFNGNKIMTTSGGGALVTHDESIADKVRHWSTQAREPLPWYEHLEIGFNHRMSNILAALGCGQIERLPAMIERRREVLKRYSTEFAEIEGVRVVGDPPWGESNAWLTTIRFDLDRHSGAPERVRRALAEREIEARPVWKPMDRQPVFADAECHRTGVADAIFASGLCLPSGSTLTDDDVDRVVAVVRSTIGA